MEKGSTTYFGIVELDSDEFEFDIENHNEVVREVKGLANMNWQ